MRTLRRWGTAALLVVALAATPALAACGTSEHSSNATQSQAERKVTPAAVQTPVKITTEPADGASDVSPTGPITVTAAEGTLDEVRLSNPEGAPVAGRLAADRHSWTTTEPLGYDRTYTWSGTARGTDGKPVPISGSFHTLRPARQIQGSLNVGDNETYGVAMPIVVSFSSPVADKAAAERALSVQTSVPVEGGWAWLDSQHVHWRPKAYYPPGTRVTVTAKLYGVPLGNGAYGREDVTSTFTIGHAQVVRANTQTHRVVVYRDGQEIANYPASFGLDSDPGRVTHSGIHVVMSKSPTYSMSNPRYHYENVVVPWAVRISNNGEFIHGLAESMWAQGKRNVSHGCANLSPANAKAYYDIAVIGDPVEVTGSSVPLGPADGDFYDWTIDWNTWSSMSALR
ncbi:L,D-transpeptidase [Gandjariella thermophila]|uniref:L,D-transpeptidase n=1 Tax=Gandjariella thermophila TaxID=1931992 RepID=UPI001CEF7BBB|nr:Ig-like domain-containing protein [Gandjariella thermophila]